MKTINTIYINLAKRLAAIVLLCTIGIGVLQAGTDYGIWFHSWSVEDRYDEYLHTEGHLIDQGEEFVTDINENTAKNTFCSKHSLGLGLRLGRYSQTGSLTMTLVNPMPSSKIALNVAHYYDDTRKKSDTGGLRVTATYTDGTTSTSDITISSSANGKSSTTEHHVVRIIPEKTLHKVTLASINPDYGRVYCKNITIYSAPIISDATVSNITKTTADFSSLGISDLGSQSFPIKSYGFVYSTTTNPTTNNTKIQVGTQYNTINKSFSTPIPINNLIPGTTYYVRPYAITDDNYDTYTLQPTTFNTQGHIATFDVGSYGTCDIQSIEEFPNTDGITLPVVNIKPGCGYRFAGWSTSSDPLTTDTLESGDHYNLEDDITFYAVYIQQFTVQWLIDGKPTTSNSPTTIVDKGSKVTQLPSPPPPADQCGQAFVGWTSTPITATQTSPPTILFTTTNASPNIYENTTFYAVFADITQ